MIVRLTDAFCANILAGITIPTMLNGGELRLYSGEPPYDLMAPTGTLMGTIRGNLGELPTYIRSGSQVSLDDEVTWGLDIEALGTPGYILATSNAGYPGCRAATSYITFPTITLLSQQIIVPQTFFAITGA